VAVEITPEPAPDEREALTRAVTALNGAHAEPPAWWRAGIREAVEDETEPDGVG
jgi:hypothetical protein